MVYFEKSQPSPNIKSTHNSQEILDRLELDFHKKCYICEEKELQNINIEHFLIKIKEHLSNQSAFTAFKRWIIRDNQALNREFQQYIGD
ncbi:MAG: hypothetical protein KAG56_01110 [Sulfurovaceae bacterium]|nr:hypothetical protein [Sulfurovaceae bacterium]